MRKLFLAVAAIGLSTFISFGAPASEASIREMLQVTEVRKLVDGLVPQMQQMMAASR